MRLQANRTALSAPGRPARLRQPGRRTQDAAGRAEVAAAGRFRHDFSRLPVHPAGPSQAPAPPDLSKAGDAVEMEAERLADEALQTPVRTPPTGEAAAPGSPPPPPAAAPGGPGEPLPQPLRSELESRFGHSFAQVRVHANAEAAELAAALDARAYTLGQRIVFGAGAWAPWTDGGRRVLAHELAHVAQAHDRPALVRRLPVNPAGVPFEAEVFPPGARRCASVPPTAPSGWSTCRATTG